MSANADNTPLAEEPAAGCLALLVIDMLSDWQFPDGETLARRAEAIAPAIAALRQRCLAAGVPCVYVNDNRGRWRSDFAAVVRAALAAGGAGTRIAQLLAPAPTDYFVLKPKHSAFHATPLDLLLRHLQVNRLILTGVACDQCVLATAADARSHDYELSVPADCVASQEEALCATALRLLEGSLRADVCRAEAIDLPTASAA